MLSARLGTGAASAGGLTSSRSKPWHTEYVYGSDLLSHASGEGHEGRFEIDFFFTEERQLMAGLNERGRQVAVVLDAGTQGHEEPVIAPFDGIDRGLLLEQRGPRRPGCL